MILETDKQLVSADKCPQCECSSLKIKVILKADQSSLSGSDNQFVLFIHTKTADILFNVKRVYKGFGNSLKSISYFT